MRWLKVAIWILMVPMLGLAGLVAYDKWLEFKRDRFYQARPILRSMHLGQGGVGTNDSAPARDELLRRFPIGSDVAGIAAALSAEGFGCQRISREAPVRMNCQLVTPPRNFGETRWIVDLHIDESDRMTQVRVARWNIWL